MKSVTETRISIDIDGIPHAIIKGENIEITSVETLDESVRVFVTDKTKVVYKHEKGEKQ